jgi:hypothetical protein
MRQIFALEFTAEFYRVDCTRSLEKLAMSLRLGDSWAATRA